MPSVASCGHGVPGYPRRGRRAPSGLGEACTADRKPDWAINCTPSDQPRARSSRSYRSSFDIAAVLGGEATVSHGARSLRHGGRKMGHKHTLGSTRYSDLQMLRIPRTVSRRVCRCGRRPVFGTALLTACTRPSTPVTLRTVPTKFAAVGKSVNWREGVIRYPLPLMLGAQRSLIKDGRSAPPPTSARGRISGPSAW